jgi:hypothetical protein
MILFFRSRPDRPEPPKTPPAPPAERKAEPPSASPAGVRQTGGLRVTVLGRGKPLSTARVRVDGEDGQGRMEFSTGSDGSQLLAQVPAGHYMISAVHPGFVAGGKHAEVEPGGVLDLRVELLPGAAVHGSVLDPSSRPVAGVAVRVIDPKTLALSGPSAETDERGGYRIDGIPLGPFGLLCFHDLYCRWTRTDLALTAQGEDPEINILLRTGTRVSGRVVDLEGRPVPGAVVQAHSADESRLVKVSDDGRFEVHGMGAAEISLAAKAKGYSPVWVRGIHPGASGIDLRLTPGASLSGQLTGSPLPERFLVRLHRVDPASGSAVPLDGQLFESPPHEFSLADVADGTYRIHVEAQGFVAADVPTVTLRPGQAVRDVTIRILKRN